MLLCTALKPIKILKHCYTSCHKGRSVLHGTGLGNVLCELIYFKYSVGFGHFCLFLFMKSTGKQLVSMVWALGQLGKYHLPHKICLEFAKR